MLSCKSFPKYQVLILLSLILACSREVKTIQICDLPLIIGNGLSIHSTDKTILISKPSGETTPNGKPQYSLYKVLVGENDSLLYHRLGINSTYTDYHPVFSPDGSFVLFNSTRPKPLVDTASGKTNIWMSQYIQGEFQNPIYLEAINTDFHDSYPTLTTNNTLYFNSERPGSQGLMDIYVSSYQNGDWSTPKALTILNSPDSENDLVVDPQERFIIFNRYEAATSEIDLYISFKEKNEWQLPQKLDELNKSGVWELTPTLSLDGETLYLEINGKIECYSLEEVLRTNS